MLLRNLNQSEDLCNGTKLIVTRLANHVIEAKIIYGGCRSKLHDESRLIQGVLMITKMMTKSSKFKITS